MAKGEDRSSGFRVVDRRPFAADGSRKGDVVADETNGEATRAAERRVPRVIPEPDGTFEEEPSGFETLVSYLSTTAMFQLGLIAGPSGEHIPADMPNAKRTLDLLDVLQQKTQGNLTARESQLLEDILYDLRMSFVEIQKRQAHKSK